MKAKVVIENGKTTITLTPENDFETDIIEKTADKGVIESSAHYDTMYGSTSKHSIYIRLTPEKK